jgi:hypothetical protein
MFTQGLGRYLPGLWIRSIFGRIRILQIRILKPDPGSGSRIRILLLKKGTFFLSRIFFAWFMTKKIKKCHLKCPHLETFVVEKCSPVMKFENLKKLNLQIMVLLNFI